MLLNHTLINLVFDSFIETKEISIVKDEAGWRGILASDMKRKRKHMHIFIPDSPTSRALFTSNWPIFSQF